MYIHIEIHATCISTGLYELYKPKSCILMNWAVSLDSQLLLSVLEPSTCDVFTQRHVLLKIAACEKSLARHLSLHVTLTSSKTSSESAKSTVTFS